MTRARLAFGFLLLHCGPTTLIIGDQGRDGGTPIHPDGGGGGCEVNGTLHPFGARFTAPDGCNTCTCSAEGAACTEMACVDAGELPCTPDECGAAPPFVCANGTSPAFQCVRSAEGICALTGGCTCTTAAGKVFAAGTSFSDGCNDCVCTSNGVIGCTKRGCNPCGGVVITRCAPGEVCIDDQSDHCDPALGDENCWGYCGVPTYCGGLSGQACPPGRACVDDPNDDCDPNRGGQDCGGVCR